MKINVVNILISVAVVVAGLFAWEKFVKPKLESRNVNNNYV